MPFNTLDEGDPDFQPSGAIRPIATVRYDSTAGVFYVRVRPYLQCAVWYAVEDVLDCDLEFAFQVPVGTGIWIWLVTTPVIIPSRTGEHFVGRDYPVWWYGTATPNDTYTTQSEWLLEDIFTVAQYFPKVVLGRIYLGTDGQFIVESGHLSGKRRCFVHASIGDQTPSYWIYSENTKKLQWVYSRPGLVAADMSIPVSSTHLPIWATAALGYRATTLLDTTNPAPNTWSELVGTISSNADGRLTLFNMGHYWSTNSFALGVRGKAYTQFTISGTVYTFVDGVLTTAVTP